MKYPCNYCEKDRCEGGCDNKFCPVWQHWFRHRWAYTQGLWRIRL